MTYNILDGGHDFDAVLETIKTEKPDFLTINEANGFDENNNQKLKEFAEKTGFSHFHLALSGEDDYHVAVFSKLPLREIREITPLARAGILVVIDSDFGEICVLGTHLTPFGEDLRMAEIDLLISAQTPYANKILMGDMNSLAKSGQYSVKMFSEKQATKFVNDNQVRYDVTERILSSGYIDTAVLCDTRDTTVPTPVNRDPYHAELRLDYIFVSDSLRENVASYSVVKNALTDKASDHYPIVVSLDLQDTNAPQPRSLKI